MHGPIPALLTKRLRQAWPKVKIIFRCDSGFCRWRMLRWCEDHGVYYIVGLAKNSRLNEMAQAQCGTIRLKLLKTGAVIRRNTRRIYFHLSPYQKLFLRVARRLSTA